MLDHPGQKLLKRIFHRTFPVLFAVLLAGAFPAVNAGDPKPQPQLGINLAGPCDWNTELPFVDLMHFSRVWASQKKGLPFGTGPTLDLDANGYPKSLSEEAWAESPLISFGGHPWPSGNYTVLYKGLGKLSFGASATGIIEQSPGRMVVTLNSGKGDLHLSILETEQADPICDIHVIMPGFEKTWRSNPWSPLFLGRWQGMACLRFMDFMATNNSAIRTWGDRPRLTDATFAGRGVPLELLIDLSNRLHADPWFCIPHMADDEFVRKFATMVCEKLNPSLKAHIEYSNEVWNPGFRQNRYAAEKGIALGLAKEPSEAAWLYTSKRSVEIFRIFEGVFGGRKRLVRILPAQSGNTFMARKILDYENASAHADALAIAPYVGLIVGGTADRYNPLTADVVARWDVPTVLERLNSKSLPDAIESMRAFRELASAHGLDLLAYEGGQHLVGVRGAENNAQLTELFLAANADPGMGDIYSRMFEAWKARGGSLFCHFSSVSKWSKWGSWGALQYFDDAPASSPKFMAMAHWAGTNGQSIGSAAKQVHQMPVRKNIDAGK